MIPAHELIERITAAAKYAECLVIIREKSQANLRWANSTLTTNGVIAEQDITVLAFVEMDGGIATGSATRSHIEIDQIEEIVRAAELAARASGKADDAMPIRKDFAIGDWSAAHTQTNGAVFAQIAPALGHTFAASIKDGIELFGYAEHTHVTTWVGSKGGLRCRFDQPAGRVEMTGKSHQRTRSTWEGRSTRDFSNISIPEMDAAIRTRLDWQARRVELAPGKYDTVAPSGAVSDLLFYMMWSAAGRDAAEGRSVFAKQGGAKGATRIGEKLSNLPINLYSDPSFPGLESVPFVVTESSSSFSSVFDNGQSLSRNEWIKDGALNSLIHTRATAQENSQPFTPMGDNMILEIPGGSGSESELVSHVKHGLLLTTLWYIREVDPTSLLLTGLTRDGVYEIRDGEIVGAVNNFRWNESPVELLSRISAAGKTEITQVREWADYVDRTAAPAVIFNEFNMSTISPAN